MTTLADLAQRILAALGDEDAAAFAQSQVEAWCLEGLRELSPFLPRLVDFSFETTAGTREYELPADFLSAQSVEYPAGETPPSYLSLCRVTDPLFANQAPVYAVLYRGDASSPDTLVIGPMPGEGETIAIRYLARHPTDLDAEDNLTLPEHHLPILVAHVIWQAWRQLVSQEMINPTSSSSLLMGQLAQNARTAKREYQRLLGLALVENTVGRPIANWKMDRWVKGGQP